MQCAIIAIGLSALAIRPPASGAMLLVPIGGGGLADTIGRAIDGGATLLAPGPLPRSIIVRADRDLLRGHLAHSGIIVIAAPVLPCGAVAQDPPPPPRSAR